MTSRVQKGGPVFRPVLKSRSRPVDPKEAHFNEDTLGSSKSTTNPLASLDSAPLPAPAATHLAFQNEGRCEPPTITQRQDHSPCQRDPVLQTTEDQRPQGVLVPASQVTPPTLDGATRLFDTAGDSFFIEDTARPLVTPSLSVSMTSQAFISSHSAAEDTRQNGAAIICANSAITPVPSTLAHKGKLPSTDIQLNESDPSASHGRKKRILARKPATEIRESQNSDEGSSELQKRRKKGIKDGTARPFRGRGPSVPPFDPHADPGEELDPTAVTMASLCSDTGQGRISSKAVEILSNHATWKAQNRIKRARMKALMEAKKYGREEGDENQDVVANILEPSATMPNSGATGMLDDTGNAFDYTRDLQTSRFNVQVRIGPNGQTVIDEESLVIDRTETEDTSNYTHVVESSHTKFVNSGTYAKRYRGSRWSAEETELFYDALSQYGENYELIAYVLPGRDRKSCKNKFKAEDKKNPARINYYLRNRTPVDLATLSRMTGKDFSGPLPEIRAPTPQINLASEKPDNGNLNSMSVDGHNKTPTNDDVVILGDINDFALPNP